MAKRPTPEPEPPRQLTAEQMTVLQLLATGQTADEAASGAGLTVRVVTAWMRYEPAFMAALNARRGEARRAAIARLERLISPALDAIEAALGGPEGWKVGLAILKFTGVNERHDFGPQTVEAVIDSEGERLHRSSLFGPSDWDRNRATSLLVAALKRESDA